MKIRESDDCLLLAANYRVSSLLGTAVLVEFSSTGPESSKDRFLVIGRSITGAEDPLAALHRVHEQISEDASRT